MRVGISSIKPTLFFLLSSLKACNSSVVRLLASLFPVGFLESKSLILGFFSKEKLNSRTLSEVFNFDKSKSDFLSRLGL